MKIFKALLFAQKAHQGQVRAGSGEPYIVHPIAVAETILQLPHDLGREDMVIAALLHDVVEDSDVKLWEIEAEFGSNVATLVHWLTKPDVRGNRAFRKEAELEKLRRAPADAQTIKYADVLDNLKTIRESKPDFADLYIEEKRRLITALSDGYKPLRDTVWLRILELQNGR